MKTLYLKNGEQKEIPTKIAKDILFILKYDEVDENHLISIYDLQNDFVLAIRVSEIKAII